jgi:hypothetical protein
MKNKDFFSFSFTSDSRPIILKVAVEREKTVQAIDVHRECTNCVVTFWVMSQFLHLQGVVQTFVIQLRFLGLYLRPQYVILKEEMEDSKSPIAISKFHAQKNGGWFRA